MYELYRLVDTHRVACSLCKGVVVVGTADLVIHAVCPVVVCNVVILRVHVAVYVELAPYVQRRRVVGIVLYVFVGAHPDACYAALYRRAALFRAGAWLVVVVNYVHVHGLAAVASVAGPVVEHVVAHVKAFVKLGCVARAEAWHAALVVCQQVVVVGHARTAPVAAVAVGAL